MTEMRHYLLSTPISFLQRKRAQTLSLIALSLLLFVHLSSAADLTGFKITGTIQYQPIKENDRRPPNTFVLQVLGNEWAISRDGNGKGIVAFHAYSKGDDTLLITEFAFDAGVNNSSLAKHVSGSFAPSDGAFISYIWLAYASRHYLSANPSEIPTFMMVAAEDFPKMFPVNFDMLTNAISPHSLRVLYTPKFAPHVMTPRLNATFNWLSETNVANTKDSASVRIL
jgi:hypothetical protein